MKILLPLALLLLCIAVNAQTPPCYTDQIWQRMTQANPTMLQQRNEAEDAISKISNETTVDAQYQNDDRAESVPAFVIPTVIYIIHDGTAASNISMQQIQSQIDQLNEDFAPHGYTFCYAKRNVLDTTYFVPQAGDSAGIFRINNAALADLDEYTEDALLKALSPLPYQRYLRIFVVANISPAGVLGYALLPGSGSTRDGIVIRADVFGSNNYCQSCNLMSQYNLGKTLTHEAGHYLNLYHTFQGGCTPEPQPGITCQTVGDRVCDTPPTEGTFGCPTPAPLSCGTTTAQQVENYMDYTNDGCKSMFSAGQKSRMDFSISAYRNTLTSIQNIIATGVTCTEIGNAYADIFCNNFNGCTNKSMVFKSLNSPGFTYTWHFGDGSTSAGAIVNHTYANTGRYELRLVAVNTTQNISAAKTITVYINECEPVNCSTNKWSSNFTYLDFSSGMPIAKNHAPLTPQHIFPSFYNHFYRADNNGNSLFQLASISQSQPGNIMLFDTAVNVADSLPFGFNIQVVPINQVPGKFCVIQTSATYTQNGYINTDSILYSYIHADNGSVHVIPGKVAINIPIPSGARCMGGGTLATSIPNCDGTLFWTILYLQGGMLAVLKVEPDTVILHQIYNITGLGLALGITSSPDGRKLMLKKYPGSQPNDNFYIVDFDKSTGYATSHTIVDQGPYTGYSDQVVCFSPNSRYLYITDGCCPSQAGNIGHIYQVDLYNPQSWDNKKVVYEFPRDEYPQHAGPAQYMFLGPDKKIYVCHKFFPSNIPAAYRLGVINFPDEAENGLNSVGYNNNGAYIIPENCPYNSVYLAGVLTMRDIPNSYGCNWQPNAPPDFNYYANGCLSYNFYTDECYSSTWNFGDPASGANNTSAQSNPTHTFSAPGSYAISLTSNGQTFTDTIYIEVPATAILQSPVACGTTNSTYSVAQPQPDVNYIWTVTGGTPASVTGAMDINVQWNTGISNGQIKLVAIDTVYGCIDSSVNTIAVTQGSIIEPVVTLSGAVLSTGTYATYQWLLNGAVIPNATQQQYTATETGLYSVIVSNNSACVDTSKPAQVTVTYIHEVSSPAFELYPNPATESLTITTSEGDAVLTVYDTHGKLVYKTNLSSTSQTLNISNWTGGIYYIEVNQEGKTARKKFVKL